MHALIMWRVHVARPELGSIPGHHGQCRLTLQFYERRYSNWMPDWLTTQIVGRVFVKTVLRAKRLAISTYAAMGAEAAALPLRKAPGSLSFAPRFASGSAAAPLRWSSAALEDCERVGSPEEDGGYGEGDGDGARQPDPDWLDDGARVDVPPYAALIAFPPPPPSPTPAPGRGSSPHDVYFRTLGVGKPNEELSRGLQPERVYLLGRGQVIRALKRPNAAALRQAEEVMRATLEVGIRFESLSLGNGDDPIIDASPEALFPPLEPKPRARPRTGTLTPGEEDPDESAPPPLGRRPLRASGAASSAPPPPAPAPAPASASAPPHRAPLVSGSGAGPSSSSSPRPPRPRRCSCAPSRPRPLRLRPAHGRPLPALAPRPRGSGSGAAAPAPPAVAPRPFSFPSEPSAGAEVPVPPSPPLDIDLDTGTDLHLDPDPEVLEALTWPASPGGPPDPAPV
eukprot:tig00000057_g18.t1